MKLRIISCLLGLGLVVWLVMPQGAKRYGPISAKEIHPETGHASVIDLASLNLRVPSDYDGRSRLILLEDGKHLAESHADHTEIRQIGKGKYSHWGRFVYFASSDNSPPQTNGRDYVVIVPQSSWVSSLWSPSTKRTKALVSSLLVTAIALLAVSWPVINTLIQTTEANILRIQEWDSVGRLKFVVARYGFWGIWLGLAIGALADQGWGLPEVWVPDEVTGLVAGMVQRDSFNPQYFYYPSLMMYACFLPCKLVSLCGLLNADNMVLIGHICRTVAAAFYLLSVYFIYKTIRLLYPQSKGTFALFFAGTIGALIYHAHLARVDICLFSMILFAVHRLVKFLKTHQERDFYLAVFACSVATGAKYPAVFLFAALPIVWLMAFGFRAILSYQFLRNFLVSIFLAPSVMLLTTPYAIFDSATFAQHIHQLIFVEGQAFRSISDFQHFLQLSWEYNLGFFSPVTFLLMLIWIGAVFSYWMCQLALPNVRGQFLKDNQDILQVSSLIAFLILIYWLLVYKIGIGQSRYFLPGSLMLALLFLVTLYWGILRTKHSPARTIACTITIFAIIICNSINAYAHVSVHPQSSKSRARGIVDSILEATPNSRIAVLSYPNQSPFRVEGLSGRLAIFKTMVPPQDESVETWDQYLDQIENFLNEQDCPHLIFEDLVVSWTVFLPKKYADDFGKRIDYPNPGWPAWSRMLDRAGYKRIAQLPSCRVQNGIQRTIGTHFLRSLDCIGGVVYVYQKCRPDATVAHDDK